MTRASATNCYFRLDDYSGEFEFGPAPYPKWPKYTQAVPLQPASEVVVLSVDAHRHKVFADATPPEGTACVVGFVDGDPDRARVLAFFGWPA